jgi:Uma2 family endonuclease
MYDLPSEDPEEPGLPDEFHDLQPQLLSATLRLHGHSRQEIFTGTDLNLYYDVRHPLWFKRPDWFLVVGVPRLYDGVDLRSSYVTWQEGVNPFVVVELLSPGTETEDLAEDGAPEGSLSTLMGNRQSLQAVPPRKWEVYEQILRVPYYIVFSRYTNRLRLFQLVGGHYQEQTLDSDQPQIWLPELGLGLGRWYGEFDGITRHWLRWYNHQGNWMLTEAEQERQRAEQERQRAEQAEAQLKQVALNLLQQGMSTAQVSQLVGLTETDVQALQDA